SLVRALFIGPLPFDDADRLVTIAERRATSRDANIPGSGPEYAAWKDQNPVFGGVALSQPDRATLTRAGEPQALDLMRVSSNYFGVTGFHAAVGRVVGA